MATVGCGGLTTGVWFGTVPRPPANILSARAQDERIEEKELAVVAQASTEHVSLVRPEPSWATAQAITAVAQDLAGEFSLRPLLERILLHCTELLACDAGSICSVDEAAGTYRKEADIGIRCQSGQVFPLTEGMTGAVVARRGPVWFDRYEDVRGGHVDAADRATLRSVIGVPLEWRGSIIGVCVVFSRDDARTFSPADAELLQLFAKHAAVALANARMHDIAEERARAHATCAERERLLREVYDTLNQGLVGVVGQLARAEDALATGNGDDAGPLVTAAHSEARSALSQTRRTMLGLLGPALDDRDLQDVLADEVEWARRVGRLDVRLVIAGQPTPLDPAQAQEILRIAQEALTNIVQHADASMVRLGIAYEPRESRCWSKTTAEGSIRRASRPVPRSGLRRMSDRAHAVGGRIELDSVPGWGTSLRVRFPYSRDRAGDRRTDRVRVAGRRPAPAGAGRGEPAADPGGPDIESWARPRAPTRRPPAADVSSRRRGREPSTSATTEVRRRRPDPPARRGRSRVRCSACPSPATTALSRPRCAQVRTAAWTRASTARRCRRRWWPRPAGKRSFPEPRCRACTVACAMTDPPSLTEPRAGSPRAAREGSAGQDDRRAADDLGQDRREARQLVAAQVACTQPHGTGGAGPSAVTGATGGNPHLPAGGSTDAAPPQLHVGSESCRSCH